MDGHSRSGDSNGHGFDAKMEIVQISQCDHTPSPYGFQAAYWVSARALAKWLVMTKKNTVLIEKKKFMIDLKRS